MDNEYLIKILEEKIQSLQLELDKAVSEKNKLQSIFDVSDSAISVMPAGSNKRSFRWTKMILAELMKADRLITTDELYGIIFDEYEGIKSLPRSKKIASLSGAVNTLKRKGAVKYVEDNINTRLYGLSEFFNEKGIPLKVYIDKMNKDGYAEGRFLENSELDSVERRDSANNIVDYDDVPF